MDNLRTCIQEGDSLMSKCETLVHIPGMLKLHRRLKAEVQFLERLKTEPDEIVELRLKSSNLSQLKAIVNCVTLCRDVTTVLDPALHVDIVCCGGSHWLKVLARKPDALEQDWFLEEKERNIKLQIDELLEVAKEQGRFPHISLVLAQGVTPRLKAALAEHNVNVYDMTQGGTLCPTDPHEDAVFLDVSTLITMISGMSHGGELYEYHDPVLKMQAESEKQAKVMDEINTLIHGRRLVSCTSAIDSFRSIVNLLAGPEESSRAHQLLADVTELPDNPSSRIHSLQITSQVKARSKVIFGTGDASGLEILTANHGFVRASEQARVKLRVKIHQPRALSQKKIIVAQNVTESSPTCSSDEAIT